MDGSKVRVGACAAGGLQPRGFGLRAVARRQPGARMSARLHRAVRAGGAPGRRNIGLSGAYRRARRGMIWLAGDGGNFEKSGAFVKKRVDKAPAL